MRYLSQLTKSDLENKTCLLRTNLDVDPDPNNLRINKAVPTIKFLLENSAKVIVFGHRGRPKEKDPNLSVEPIIDILSEKVGQKLEWLENIRFDPRERDQDKSLAEEIAAKGDYSLFSKGGARRAGDLFVNDDFATTHHPSATISYLPEYLPSYAGLLIEDELKALSKVRDNPEKPLVVILGGIKLDDKVGVIEHLYDKTDYFLLGSAYSSIKYQVLSIKDGNGGSKIIFPLDYSSDDKFDIGPKTIEKYKEIINKAKTIIWSGPLGKFEAEQHRKGSAEIAQAVAKSSAFSVIGGGDTNKLVDLLGLRDKFDFVSTGGGAMLSFLAGRVLPGIQSLNKTRLKIK